MVYRKVRPTESKAFLLNPHKGIATFGRFDGDPPGPSLPAACWATPTHGLGGTSSWTENGLPWAG